MRKVNRYSKSIGFYIFRNILRKKKKKTVNFFDDFL